MTFRLKGLGLTVSLCGSVVLCDWLFRNGHPYWGTVAILLPVVNLAFLFDFLEN